MAGLLDGALDNDLTRFGLGLLAASGPTNDPMKGAFGARLQQAIGGYDDWRQQKAQQERAKKMQEFQDFQMQQARAQAEQLAKRQALASQFQTPAEPERRLAPLMGDSIMPDNFKSGILPTQGTTIPAKPAGFNFEGYANALAGIDPLASLELQTKLQKDTSPISVKADETLLDRRTLKPIFTAPKTNAKPAEVQEYEYALSQGETRNFTDWKQAMKKAGATNVSTKVEAKMSESLAGQVGPMVKDTYTQAQGAIQQGDAANRIIKAVDSGKIIAGPLAGGRMKIAQIGQMLGVSGKDDAEVISRSRDVIRGLAELTLQGRKQMTGQGAITESEGALAEKAMSGNIEDLTPSEIRQLAAATARVAKFNYDNHQSNLQNLQQDPNTAGLAKFYKVAPFPAMQIQQPAATGKAKFLGFE